MKGRLPSLATPLITKKSESSFFDIEDSKESKEPLIPKSTLQLDDVVVKSDLADRDPHRQTQKIIEAFNHKITHSAVTTVKWNPFRGERVAPDEFLVVHRNQVPELVPANKMKIALAVTGVGTVTGIIGKIKLDTPVFDSKMGSVLLNVPVNHVALATTGTDKTPIIFGAGPHVIHDPTFMINAATSFINIMNTDYIFHGNIHILRVPAGKYAKVWINSVPELLPYQKDPYVFKGNFRPDAGTYLIDVATDYINHGYINRLRVPAGKVAKIWRGTEPVLLPSRAEAYDFHDPLFRVEAFGYDSNRNPILFENIYAAYIQHGTLHQIRVPAGKVAKIWLGSEAHLLESKSEPYEYNNPLFRLERASDRELFEDATKKLIVHGNIKRVMPDTGEVAIAYDGGKLEVFGPSEDKERKAILKTSPTFRVDEFLETNLRTLTFPSDVVKKARREENKATPVEEINYEVYKLGDGSRVGVKLVVTFEIKDPEVAVKRLGKNSEILKHIENIAAVDMAKALQNCNGSDFLTFQYTTTQKAMDAERKSFDLFTATPPLEDRKFLSVLDKVRNALTADLSEYGIVLRRLNSSAPLNMNRALEEKAEAQSLASTETSAKLAVMDNQRRIAEMTAKQDAEVKQIEQAQLNASLVAAAEAKRQAAELEAKATEIKAITDAKKTTIEAKARAEAIEMEAAARAKATEMQGVAEAKALKSTSEAQAASYATSPQLFHIAMASVMSKAVQSMNITVGSEKVTELAEKMLTLSSLSNLGFFSSAPKTSTEPSSSSSAELKSGTPVPTLVSRT